MEGWTEGLSYMKEGGEATIIIPYKLTFEGNYEPLVYYLELLEVKQKGISMIKTSSLKTSTSS